MTKNRCRFWTTPYVTIVFNTIRSDIREHERTIEREAARVDGGAAPDELERLEAGLARLRVALAEAHDELASRGALPGA